MNWRPYLGGYKTAARRVSDGVEIRVDRVHHAAQGTSTITAVFGGDVAERHVMPDDEIEAFVEAIFGPEFEPLDA